MEFRLAFTPKPFTKKINHQHGLLLLGSCFTENMGAKLRNLKFSVKENPHGILFNPVSISTALQSYASNKQYAEDELFYKNECWNSWDHHSRFSHPDKKDCIDGINLSQQAAFRSLQKADWVMITVGSAFVYELQEDRLANANARVVANCHKVPMDKFNKRLLSVNEVTNSLRQSIESIHVLNPAANIIFTISPVRHLRDGFIENNRSKATLIQAIHILVDENEHLFYFPAYELIIDDLRDYRFFAEDMVHPNYTATNYVWDKFISTAVDDTTQTLMKDINTLNAAKNHKPFNPSSAAHKTFMQTNLIKVVQLKNDHPHLDLNEEEAFFKETD